MSVEKEKLVEMFKDFLELAKEGDEDRATSSYQPLIKVGRVSVHAKTGKVLRRTTFGEFNWDKGPIFLWEAVQHKTATAASEWIARKVYSDEVENAYLYVKV